MKFGIGILVVVLWSTVLACTSQSELLRANTARALGDLRTRAAFDFKCPEANLQLQELGNFSTQGVTGCGRQATYVYSPRGTWIMNTQEGTPEKN